MHAAHALGAALQLGSAGVPQRCCNVCGAGLVPVLGAPQAGNSSEGLLAEAVAVAAAAGPGAAQAARGVHPEPARRPHAQGGVRGPCRRRHWRRRRRLGCAALAWPQPWLSPSSISRGRLTIAGHRGPQTRQMPHTVRVLGVLERRPGPSCRHACQTIQHRFWMAPACGA